MMQKGVQKINEELTVLVAPFYGPGCSITQTIAVTVLIHGRDIKVTGMINRSSSTLFVSPLAAML